MERKPRTAFGVAMSLLTGLVAALNFPDDLASAVARWSEASVEIPAEVVRLFLVAGLGTVAAWGLAPGLGFILHILVAKSTRNAQKAQKKKDVRDALAAKHADWMPTLRRLLDGPQELISDEYLPLVEAGLVERVSETRSEMWHTWNVCRLSEIGREIVEESEP